MLNLIWAGMIIAGVVYATFTGNIQVLSNETLESAKEAVTLCITMLGIVGMWCGIMEIAKEAGIVAQMSKLCGFLVGKLFPDVPKDSEAFTHITTNMIANVLGLGWAATPSGLLAMKELSKLNNHSNVASDDMCTFLVLNISSLQLIPVNIIAYRSQYGSVNPSRILLAGIVATMASTLVAVAFCILVKKFKNKNNRASGA
ncbi:MAG: nucleoside recognition domain-containing protein [Lachnospiraceae bacterium]